MKNNMIILFRMITVLCQSVRDYEHILHNEEKMLNRKYKKPSSYSKSR